MKNEIENLLKLPFRIYKFWPQILENLAHDLTHFPSTVEKIYNSAMAEMDDHLGRGFNFNLNRTSCGSFVG